MQDPFDQKKQAILDEISTNSSDNLDASPKGTIDEKCIPIINLINKDPNMVTTSSCSGRVSVFLEGKHQEGQNKIIAKGNEGRWLFVTHNPEDLPKWYDGVDFKYLCDQFPGGESRSILFKFEPLILHVKCRDLNQASKLYTVAMNCGFRESGIGSNYNVAIRISIKLDIPIGYGNDSEELVSFVSKEYLEYATKLSYERFTENFKKMNQLYDAIDKMMSSGDQQKVKDKETKEERRERKIREGLQRQQELKQKQQQQQQQEEEERTE
ncbi:uncharacterized protein SPAPADRAFT_134561 [Spathaspora passalidarum NRRL Y-27907]|uniref:tRNA wybutosine-synthesizing protein 3 n=1 Tax=Spathaspora passalidarum (strain NRRL Y-27907 / 11-Y1) TaxID=619300 RepID=G3AI32_SPAPN|nr:uncharacterized protein SPAPADRAFT_134561 [Spathaspora passalidarum NRRL Y-27907]EGW34347.1 hypothetical protein SPAPADRAFT_134561 [Spathaspora passalidarum NRRL Y-27907]